MEFPFGLQSDREFGVVGFGTNAVDYLITVPEYPEFDSKIELEHYSRFAGGEIATTVTGLQRLGIKTMYVGRFGDDEAGDYGLKTLVDEGIETKFAEQVAEARTQIAFIIIDARNGERTIIWKRDPALSFSPDEVSEELATLGSILHFTPHDTQACLKLAKTAKASRTLVSIDVDRIIDGVEDLLPFVDVLICSQDFARRFTGRDDKEDALQVLRRRFGSSVVGMTVGAEGSLVLCNDEIIKTEGFGVPGGCKDTTGAGDSFRAGFLFGILNNQSVEETCRIANAVAALKCREVGARTALPDRNELRAFLEAS